MQSISSSSASKLKIRPKKLRGVMVMKRNLCVVLVSLGLFAVGCSRVSSPTDAQIASEVKDKITADNNVPDKQLTINANGGTVTLSGTVSSDAARNAAASDAGQIAGVKTVINNLQTVPAIASNQTPPSQEQASNSSNLAPPVKDDRRPSPRTRERNAPPPPANNKSNNGDNGSSASAPPPGNHGSNDSAQAIIPPPPEAPPAPPVPQKITVPAGTQLSVRFTDEVDSGKAQIGDIFHGSISAPVSVDDQPVLPTTADVEGRVVDVKSAGKFAGQAVLTLELTRLTLNGKSYTLQTSQWSKTSTGQGKATAAKVGGGAAVGAILGGILGGGKGAAIGGAAGAGAGTGVSAAGKGQQVIVHPEQIIAFQLQSPITVTTAAPRPAMNQ
jgi:BON domain-containing protein